MRAALADALVAAIAAGAAIGGLEAVVVGGGAGLAATIVALHIGLGLVIGGAMLASETAVDRFRLGGVFAALVRAVPAVAVLVPVGATLFEGGFATTLPGARSAPMWFPAVGAVAIAVVAWLGARAADGRLWLPARAARAVIAGGAALLLIAAELANRLMFASEYPRVHMMLVVVSCVALALVARTLLAGAPPLRRRTRGAVAAVAAAIAVAAIGFGLGTEDARWAVATRGNHARHLANTVRALVDFDRDGYAAVLGGGDCDDGDAARNPGAVDVPGNGADEDCDGADSEPVAPRREAWAEASEARGAAETRALVDRLSNANLLILSVDALRADAFADPERSRREFPNLWRLLGESRWFTRALAPSSGTDVSLASLVTSRHNPFLPIETTLFEALSAAGAEVHAVLPREVLRWAPRRLLTRGVAGVHEVINDGREENVGDHTTSVETTERGLEILRAIEPDHRFALWLHYFDVHEHLQLRSDDPELARLGRDVSTTEGKYLALLSLIDLEVGQVLAELDARGLADHTVVVLFSDHGESLGEDPRLPQNHGKFVYRALTEIPLAIRVPGVEGARIDELVTLIDVFPTLVDLLSLPRPKGLAGHSLLSHMPAGAPPAPHFPGRALVTRDSHQWGVIEWPHKLMYRPDDNLYELYDLSRDPGEHDNLADRDGKQVRRLKQIYQSFPKVSFDRTRKGRRWREAQGRPPARR